MSSATSPTTVGSGPVTAFRLPPSAPATVAGERAGRIALGATLVLWTGAVTLLVAALAGRAPAAGPLRVAGWAVTGWRADRLAALLAVMVATVGVTVCAFAIRYLRGDRRAVRFFVTVPTTVLAVGLLLGATTPVGLAAGWTLSELGVLALVGLYRPAPDARRAYRTTARAFAVGDVALWAAVAVVWRTWGNVDLQAAVARPPAAGGHGTAAVVLAVLLATAVAARCALLPFDAWLPSTLAAPTPVSAFLHAGIVNAGGILLVRLAPLVGPYRSVQALAFAVGAVTVVAATAAAAVEPSVKGTLVRSTSAQMGFMIVCCGLGWYLAAVLHLVGHGLYKSTLFLGSGSAVTSRAAERRSPPAPGRTSQVPAVVATVLPAVALVAVLVRIGPVPGRAQLVALGFFGWATAARAGRAWVARLTGPLAGLAVSIGLAAAAGAYLAFARVVGEFLAPSVAGIPTGAVPAAGAVILAAALAGGALVVRSPRAASHPVVRRAWLAAAAFGHPPTARRLTVPRPSPRAERRPAPVGAGLAASGQVAA